MGRNILNVFIASPSDLEPERIASRECVADTNIVIRDLDWMIELHSWEDVQPGVGRPQELINTDVDQCDLFIGLLWKRWGTPTGEHGSGFEEEFVRALDRNKRTGSPEIWLFFKDVPEDILEDPGVQLSEVMKFYRERKLSQDVLFGKFNKTEDWRARLSHELTRFVIGKNRAAHAAVSDHPAGTRIPTADMPEDDSVELQGTDTNQLVELFTKLQKSTCDEPNSYSFDLTDSEAARLYLFASTFHQNRFSDEYPDANAINALYVHRADHQFSSVEKRLLLRSIIADAYSVVPGWFWFRDLEPDTILDMLLFMGTHEQDESVKIAAIRMMTTIPIELPTDDAERQHAINMMFAGDSAKVRKAGLQYLESVGQASDVAVLQNDKLVDEASLSVVEQLIGARIDPERIAREVCEQGKGVADGVLSIIRPVLGTCNEAIMRAGLKHDDVSVRLACLDALLEREADTEEIVRELLQDKSTKVRQRCYQELVEHGERFEIEDIRNSLAPKGKGTLLTSRSAGDPDAVILEMFSRYDLADLRHEISWFKLHGRLAYRAMATKFFSESADQLRQDVEDNFAQLRLESIERLRAESSAGTGIDSILTTYAEKGLDEFIRVTFVEAALAALSDNGDERDVELARSFLQSDMSDMEWNLVGKHAIALLARVGDSSDAKALARVALDSAYSVGKEEAARAALRFDPGLGDTARELLQSDDEALVKVALQALLKAELSKVLEVVEPLLNREQTGVRIAAVKFCHHTCSVEYMAGLLERYLAQPMYYYNVVCEIDRALYAPEPVRNAERIGRD